MNTSNESKRPSAEPCNLFAPDDIVRHVRSGHICRVLGRCTIEATLADCYMYRCTDGHVWIRPVLEMEDGRFVLLTRELDAAQPAQDTLVDAVAKALADAHGHGMREKCEAEARRIVESAQPAQAGEAVYQVKFRTQGSGWVTVDRESYESPLAYLPEHYERRVAYVHPQPEQPASAKCGCGLATCVEPWEPGCGLGTSKEHAARVDEQSPAVSPPSVVAVAVSEDFEATLRPVVRWLQAAQPIEWSPIPRAAIAQQNKRGDQK